MSDNSINDFAKRLRDVEVQNRSLRWSLSGLSMIAVVLLTLGAASPEQNDRKANASFGTLHTSKVVISDDSGRERMVLELANGEPSISMFNHEGQRQVYLGIDEEWEDTAYLSVSSRLSNGDVDKQAVLAATTTHPQLPGNSQLILYDAKPGQKTVVRRHLVRLSSGYKDRLPYLEIRQTADRGEGEVNLDLLEAEPVDNGVLLNTNSDPAMLSGVSVAPRE